MNLMPKIRLATNLLFWPWNIVFVTTLLFGFVPLGLIPMIVDAIDGLAPWGFVSGALLMTVTPILCVAHVIHHREAYRDDPVDLLSFFFGVELPLLGMTAARLFGFQQLTGAGELVYLAIVAGGLVAEARVVLGDRMPRSQILDGALHSVLVMRAIAGIYVGAILASLTMPLLGVLLVQMSKASEGGVIGMVVLFPLTLWFGLSTLLVLFLPIGAPLAWLQGLVRSGRQVRGAWGLDDLFITTAAPVIAAVVVVAMQWAQPHEDALARLATPPTTDAARRALVADRDHIARGLVDAALGSHTYVDDDGATPWSDLWHLDGALGSSHDFRAVDPLMRDLARPFVYKGDLRGEAREARRLYREFFGTELERDHAPAVRAALSSTWSREERFAGFIDEGQSRVRLEQQDVEIVAQDSGVFSVAIHDVWLNQTANDEEVALFFELPESAAVTGLWLGPTPNRDEAFTHITAPRGAAQQVYREEVRAKRDPALLEQVGPRQYRLRVFPIPPRQRQPRSDLFSSGWSDVTAPRVHVWLTYEALPDDDGKAPLPLLRERRNGFWDADTVRRLAPGNTLMATDAIDGGSWVQVPASSTKTLSRRPVAAMVTDGCAALVPAPVPAMPSLTGRTVDVVIDRSLEMGEHVLALENALTTLAATGATVRVVLGTSSLRGEGPAVVEAFTPAMVKDLVFFGAAQPKALLRQLIEVRSGKVGDVIVVLAGSASFDVADDVPLPLDTLPGKALPRTLLVHVSGRMPAGYDDATLDAIRRSGGTATANLRDGLLRLQDTVWIDGYRFDTGVDARTRALSGQPCAEPKAPGSAVVARQQILLADRGGKAPLDALDSLHRLAVSASVATPYSSLIVLVNDAQRRRLAELTKQEDRFDREVDDESKGPAAGAIPPAPPEPRPAEEPRQNTMKTAGKVQGAPTSLQGAPPSVATADTRADKKEESLAAPGADKDAAASLAPTLDGDALANEATPTTTQPTAVTSPLPTVSGVPEPEEWLLFFLGLGVVLYSQRRRLLSLR